MNRPRTPESMPMRPATFRLCLAMIAIGELLIAIKEMSP